MSTYQGDIHFIVTEPTSLLLILKCSIFWEVNNNIFLFFCLTLQGIEPMTFHNQAWTVNIKLNSVCDLDLTLFVIHSLEVSKNISKYHLNILPCIKKFQVCHDFQYCMPFYLETDVPSLMAIYLLVVGSYNIKTEVSLILIDRKKKLNTIWYI